MLKQDYIFNERFDLQQILRIKEIEKNIDRIKNGDSDSDHLDFSMESVFGKEKPKELDKRMSLRFYEHQIEQYDRAEMMA